MGNFFFFVLAEQLKLAVNEKHLSQIKYQSYPFKVCSKSEYKLCELCSVNMNATTSLQVGQAKQMPHVIYDTGGRNYVWGDIIQLRITTRSPICLKHEMPFRSHVLQHFVINP